jgi:hypothetical protein
MTIVDISFLNDAVGFNDDPGFEDPNIKGNQSTQT